LARQVQLLLYGFGIPSTVSSSFNTTHQRDYWTVTINPAVAHRFLNEIGFRSARRAAQVAANFRRSPRDAQFENVPNIVGLIRDLRDDLGGDRAFDRCAGDLFRGDMALSCSRQRLTRIIEWADARSGSLTPTSRAITEYLRHLLAHRYTFERVEAIEDGGTQPTFDVVLPRTHSFIANGMVSHNTTVALHAIAEAQKLGGIAAFIDAEHALDPKYAAALGVDIESLLVSQPDTGEQALEITDMLIRSGAVDMVVIDSVAALTPRAEIEGEMGDSHVGLQARLMSQALRKLAGTLSKSKTCAVFINQIREKIGVMFGSPETQPGGRALKFYSSVRLDVRRIESLKDGTDFVGNRVRVKVVKNKVAPPFRQAEFDIMFGEGISREGSILDVGVDAGFVRKAGAWYTYDGEQLGQGRENARNFLREHDDVASEIYKKVTEHLGLTPSETTGEDTGEDTGDDGDPDGIL
jgi:recombination protein RecA